MTPADDRRIRILLADDHETVREGLKAILASQQDLAVIGEADDGDTAISRTKEMHPDVVVMDVSMPRLNGLQATATIVHDCPDTKVLVLTRHADPGYVQQFLRVGASGYVLKQSPVAALYDGVRAIAAGSTYLDGAIERKPLHDPGHRDMPATPAPTGRISGREEEVLRLVAWGRSNKEIAGELGLSVKTIETHKANAARKLGLRNRMEVVKYALLQGWLKET